MMKSIKGIATKGFTLIELLLVMVIISIIVLAGTRYMVQKATSLRIDRTAIQMQYVLNAGLAYYVANGTWPGAPGGWNLTTGFGWAGPLNGTYLPTNMVDPWFGSGYWYGVNSGGGSPPGTFLVLTYVGTSPQQQAIGNIIAAKIPFGQYNSGTGYLIAYVNPPGQNLNNATAVNFAGLYHQGGCVPVPLCPNTTASSGVTTSPQVFVVPVSVSGVNDPNSSNIYPISSFTAFATAISAVGGTPPACYSGDSAAACTPINGNAPQSGQYWRACLQVVTQRGDVQVTNTTSSWGQDVTLAAFTRCAISNEPAGSTFSVYTH